MNFLTRFGVAARGLTYLRRMAASNEVIAEALRSLAVDSRERYEREFVRPKPQRSELGVLDLRESERRWRQQRVEAGLELDEDESQ